ncbi:hypothetical protein ANO11243_050760 [Dothideomycetidae sp. 11243]|nr:hypothetical protein ANO11243_050760 [fungal sp. No.11243]
MGSKYYGMRHARSYVAKINGINSLYRSDMLLGDDTYLNLLLDFFYQDSGLEPEYVMLKVWLNKVGLKTTLALAATSHTITPWEEYTLRSSRSPVIGPPSGTMDSETASDGAVITEWIFDRTDDDIRIRPWKLCKSTTNGGHAKE